MSTPTGLLRAMACRCLLGEPCARCQALALAEELERQLAAAQAALQYAEPLILRADTGYYTLSMEWCHLRQIQDLVTDCRQNSMAALDAVRDALTNGAIALAARDERVRREALESAAVTWASLEIAAMSKGDDLPDTVEWLRERAKGGGS